MKYKKFLVIPLTASLILAACGHDGDKDNEPGKISGNQPQHEKKDKNNDSSKKQKGEAKNDSKKDDKDQKNKDGQLTKKDDESHNEILTEGEKSKKYGKSKPTAKADYKKLPKDVKKASSTSLQGFHYMDLHGEDDISQKLNGSAIENPDKVATDATHDKVYKYLDKMYKDVAKYNKDNKSSTGINTNANDKVEKLGKKYFYTGEEDGINTFIQYQKQGWKLDKSSLKVTDYGAENVWMYEIDLVDDKGHKEAVVAGKYYDIIKQLTVRDSHSSNDGVTSMYRDANKKGSKQY